MAQNQSLSAQEVNGAWLRGTYAPQEYFIRLRDAIVDDVRQTGDSAYLANMEQTLNKLGFSKTEAIDVVSYSVIQDLRHWCIEGRLAMNPPTVPWVADDSRRPLSWESSRTMSVAVNKKDLASTIGLIRRILPQRARSYPFAHQPGRVIEIADASAPRSDGPERPRAESAEARDTQADNAEARPSDPSPAPVAPPAASDNASPAPHDDPANARAEAERILREAQSKAKVIEDQARAGAEALRRQAQADANALRAKAKSDAEAAAKEIEQSAREEAEKRADQLVAEHVRHGESARLETETRQRARDAWERTAPMANEFAALKSELSSKTSELKGSWRSDLDQAVERLQSQQEDFARTLQAWQRSLYHYEMDGIAQSYVELYAVIQGAHLESEALLGAEAHGEARTESGAAKTLLDLSRRLATVLKHFENGLASLGLAVYLPEAGERFNDVLQEDVSRLDDPYDARVRRCVRPGIVRLDGAGDDIEDGTPVLMALVELTDERR